MLIAHKAIDAIRSGRLLSLNKDAELHRVIASGIEEAEKFDFGALLLEPLPSNQGHHEWQVPMLEPAEADMWRQGLLPLPAATVWFEYVINGWRSALLISEVEGTKCWRVARFDWQPASEELVWEGCVLEADPCVLGSANGTLVCKLVVGNEFAQRFRGDKSKIFTDAHMGANVHLGLYLNLMLNSRTTERTREIAPPRLNKARLSRGRAPLYDHHVITIVPTRYIRDAEAASSAERRPPRLHWRSSHIRHVPHATPSSKPLPDGRHGIAIARMLVGRAETGTVTHEYRVRL